MRLYDRMLKQEVLRADGFREFTKRPEDPSLKEHISPEPQPFQKEIVDYLKRKGADVCDRGHCGEGHLHGGAL